MKSEPVLKETGSGRTTPAGLIIAVLGMLAGFAPLATDMYLPGFPLMAEDFGVPQNSIELTLSVFFLGLAVGQGIYGPLIDRYGRRGPMLGGIALYVLATIGCLLAPNVEVLIAMRFLQAIGGSAGMVVGRAIVRDLFDAQEAARALSLLMMTMAIAPIVAPVLGGFIITHGGWQAVFGAMLALGVCCGVLVWRLIPETLPTGQRQSISPGGTLEVWRTLMSDRRFAVPAIAGGLAQASMFAFITGSPFVFITLHGASAQTYGWLFALIACALIVSAQINRFALRFRRPEGILGLGLLVNVSAGLATVASVSTGNLIVLLVPLWLAIGSLGLISANAATVAMVASGRHAGSGSSLVGVLQFGFAFIVSSLVAAAQNGTAYPMTLAILGCGSGAAILWFVVRSEGRRS